MANPENESPNDGSELERLVKLIEGRVLSKGFDVQTNRRVYNDAGVQIAELDIVITGNVGSAPFNWLIECRDRPSEGSAPGSWIEQLATRRDRFGFDKVMAVSTTGFAAGAKEEAERTRIDLRLLQNLTYDDVSHWLPPNAPLTIRQATFNVVRVHLIQPEDSKATEECICKFGIDEPKLIHRENKETLSIRQFWQKVIAEDSLFQGLVPDGPPKTATVTVKQELRDQYFFDLDGDSCEIGGVEFDATLSAVVPKMPLVQAAEYQSQPSNPEHSETFVQLGRWQGSEDGVIKELRPALVSAKWQ